jgi:hypothetical protein
MTGLRNFGRPAIPVCLFWFLGSSMAQQDPELPETVIVTLRAKPGAEADLERAIARHWTTAHRMKLVHDTPHVTLRGTEEGNKSYFIEIFTWRDGGIPDAAPAEIQTIWNEFNRLVEARGGHPGIEFVAVSVVTPFP